MKNRSTRLRLDSKVIKQGAKVAALAGVGAVAAKVGGRVVTRMSAGVANFAAKSATNQAVVEAVSGVAIDLVLLLAIGKLSKSPKKAAQAAPFLVGGTLVAAAAPAVGARVIDAVDGAFAKVLPGSVPAAGGLYADPYAGLGGELPVGGGLFAEPSLGLGGELPVAGGLYTDQPSRYGAFIGGELPARA